MSGTANGAGPPQAMRAPSGGSDPRSGGACGHYLLHYLCQLAACVLPGYDLQAVALDTSGLAFAAELDVTLLA